MWNEKYKLKHESESKRNEEIMNETRNDVQAAA